MFASAPILVMKRKILIRLIVCLFLLPLTLVFAYGIYASLQPPSDSTSATFDAVLALLCGGTVLGVMVNEAGRVTRLHPEGIEQTRRGRTAELRWDDVTEVWFQAVKVQVGGVAGYAISAFLDRKRQGSPLNERDTSITVRLHGRNGEKLVINSNDQGIVKGYETVLAHVNPRLLEEARRRVEHGDTVAFGKISVSLRGIASGRKEIAFHEIEKLEIAGGKLRVKKKGAWLDALSVPVKKIPNVSVLTELYAHFASGPVDRKGLQMGQNLAGRTMIAG
ncbi:MAG: DUF6585 family protein [Acidobacteriota bacterium]